MSSSLLFPPVNPFAEGTLEVSDLHTLHYEEVGNPRGECALFLHGGPGVGILPGYRRFFDPEHYRIVLPDQRGAGRSKPHAELQDNTTWNLVEDLEALRHHLGISNWTVMGGSWGSLLALCYAIRYPESISGIVLRGVFFGRPRDLAWVYEGVGTAHIFPEKWMKFRSLVDGVEEVNTVEAYYSLLTNKDEAIALRAANSWAEWSASTMTLMPNAAAVAEIASDNSVLPVSRIECHYAQNSFFLPTDNYVLENVSVIQEIPCLIVQGRYDVICPSSAAWELHRALCNSELEIVPSGSHSPMEPEMSASLIRATNRFKDIVSIRSG